MIMRPVDCRRNQRNQFNSAGICPNVLRKVSDSMITVLHHYAIACIAIGFATPAMANHPGEKIDSWMLEQEKYFQVIDEPTAPPFELEDANGETVRLSDFEDNIVVLHFVYANCPDICPLHTNKVAELQAMVNTAGMAEQVQFISVTTDPKNDRGVMANYGIRHGLDPGNWTMLTKLGNSPDDTTRKLALKYGLKFTMTADGDMQMHAAVVHIIDRGRLAAKFHGMKFQNTNAVLYINGLVYNQPHPPMPESWWQRLFQ